MPFDIGFYAQRPPVIPEYMPFELGQDPKTGLIRQQVTEELRSALKSYYELGGYLSTPLGEGAYATGQGDFFLRALERALGQSDKTIAGLDFLEVGSGYGYVVRGLLDRGAKSAIGIEPGEDGVAGSERWGVSIIKDFFPTPQLAGKQFDVVLSHGVLEHIEDPTAMLRATYESVKEGGLVFAAVPECEKKMSVGDLSIITHQHVNYFTKDTLRTALAQAGFSKIVTMISPKRSILFAWGVKDSGATERMDVNDSDGTLLERFSSSFTINVRGIQRVVDELKNAHKTLSLYAPSANLAGLISYDSPPRTFNKDDKKLGMHISPAARSFESPLELVKDPTDAVLIAPIDYDDEIKADLRSMGLLLTTQLISLKELYQNENTVVYESGSLTMKEEFVVVS